VLLFYLLMHGHPLSGVRTDASCSWERGARTSETELLLRNFGIEPVFIFDPEDPSNRPVPGDRALTWWPIYPEQCRRDRDYRTACAVVEPDPRQSGRSVLRNLTGRTWTVVPDGEEPKRAAPDQRLGIRPIRIDFGLARGQIL
jgi:hypothetical protein